MRENSEFVDLELVVGSGEQDSFKEKDKLDQKIRKNNSGFEVSELYIRSCEQDRLVSYHASFTVRKKMY